MYKVRVTRFKLFLEVPSGTLNFFSLCNQECLNFFFEDFFYVCECVLCEYLGVK